MADPDDQPSLELPSLGGWRRRRRARRPEPTPAPIPSPAPSGGEQATVVVPETVADAPQDGVSAARRASWRPRLRRPSATVTVVLTGILVGLAMVGLTWASLRGCEQVRGTSSCGQAGYPVLGLVLALAVLVGAALLRAGRVPDPATTSTLGVGVAAVLALLLLIDHLDQPAMVLVIPAITALTFMAAHWLTTTFVEPGGR